MVKNEELSAAIKESKRNLAAEEYIEKHDEFTLNDMLNAGVFAKRSTAYKYMLRVVKTGALSTKHPPVTKAKGRPGLIYYKEPEIDADS